MVEFSSSLRFYTRTIPAMRQKLLAFIFSRIPADCAAIVSVSGGGTQIETLAHHRKDPSSAVTVNEAMVEHVFRTGQAMMSPSLLCVPMHGFDARLGVIYATTATRGTGFSRPDFELLTTIATVGSFALERAAHTERLLAENTGLKRDLDIRDDLIGDDAAMKELGNQIATVAPTDSTVLILGESGTGKELIARAVHRQSKRAQAPFVAINCGAISESLLESELFGHERGAFTGAIAQKKGKFELASGGTLFLDEVGELPASIQVKLLRVLQEREIERLGGVKPIKVDIRLIAATNRDLDAEVARNGFRHDLYYRIKVVTIDTPPLRTCGEDILRLARHFVARFSRELARHVRGISPKAENLLMRYRWPGNVRELQNMMERAVVVGKTDWVLPVDLPREVLNPEHAGDGANSFNLEEAALAAQRAAVERAYAHAGGNWKQTAILLGKNRTHIYKLVKKLGVEHLR
jgi:Nif-specific regulatory protein